LRVIKLLQSNNSDGCPTWAVIVIKLAGHQLNDLGVIGVNYAITDLAGVMPLV
jgi:hypothetical protein